MENSLRFFISLIERWSLIAGRLPGRTDNVIKNHWNIHLQKKVPPQESQRKKTFKINTIKPVVILIPTACGVGGCRAGALNGNSKTTSENHYLYRTAFWQTLFFPGGLRSHSAAATRPLYVLKTAHSPDSNVQHGRASRYRRQPSD